MGVSGMARRDHGQRQRLVSSRIRSEEAGGCRANDRGGRSLSRRSCDGTSGYQHYSRRVEAIVLPWLSGDGGASEAKQ
jgi:hypothetical protein